MTFGTLLVANRGEIAVRIIRTAHDLGLRTAAVHSDADRGCPTRPALRRGRTAGPGAREGVVPGRRPGTGGGKDSGADAIHPRYGFLSEDAATTLPRPMTLGSVQLADGTRVPGVLCEPGASPTPRTSRSTEAGVTVQIPWAGQPAQGRGELRDKPHTTRTRRRPSHPTDE
ncbi:biotin carboxylase N-terminal domain-containing protein [Streptomyces sp. TRM68367]|uniref:biotin carboxylase N-terminal domain-containing protein n=1 Tax=Streptomyces sp. TRM68367 TaxID=2758415 RepID=UPI0037DC5242